VTEQWRPWTVSIPRRLTNYNFSHLCAKVAAADAEQTRDRAVASLDGVRSEAAKATSNAERHQEVPIGSDCFALHAALYYVCVSVCVFVPGFMWAYACVCVCVCV